MKTIKPRISINDLEPEVYKAMFGLEKYLNSIDLNPAWKNLIKIRASQINGCAFCIEMHTKDARKAGESERRLYALSAWEESPLFTDEERTLLAMTEEITLIKGSKGTTPQGMGQLAVKQVGQFEVKQVGQLRLKRVGQYGVIFSN